MESIGIAVLAFLLCCINLVLWLIFLRKFNRFFSTEKIIQNTRLEVENIMRDLNRATDRDMTIIEARLKEIKAASAEAERHILVARTELEKQVQISQLQKTISSKEQNRTSEPYSEQLPPQRKNQAVKSYENISDGLFSANSYSLTKEGQSAVKQNQPELFAGNEDEPFVNSSAGTKFSVDRDGAGVASIPKIGPNVHFADDPIMPKKTLNQQIKELSDKGYSAEMIAHELNLTITEVQFSLDMEV